MLKVFIHLCRKGSSNQHNISTSSFLLATTFEKDFQRQTPKTKQNKTKQQQFKRTSIPHSHQPFPAPANKAKGTILAFCSSRRWRYSKRFWSNKSSERTNLGSGRQSKLFEVVWGPNPKGAKTEEHGSLKTYR